VDTGKNIRLQSSLDSVRILLVVPSSLVKVVVDLLAAQFVVKDILRVLLGFL
jgi:hypothetical protein